MKRNGYSLIEVLVAGAILLIGIAAAAVMINALFVQESADARTSQSLNMMEQAATLWQLGLEPATITNILPAKCSPLASPPADSIYIEFNATSNTTAVSPGIPVDILNPLRVVCATGIQEDGSPVYRTNTNVVVRPTTR